jgi:hypothetical protein
MPESASFLEHFNTAISHATAPAFMLGAVAAFLNVIVGRFEKEVDRFHVLRVASPAAPAGTLAAVSRRLALLHRGMVFAALSGLCTAALLIVLFTGAIFDFPHRTGVASMFALALLLLMVSIIDLIRDLRVNFETMRVE